MANGLLLTSDIVNRFESKYFVTPDGCWLWTDCLSSTGYGSFHLYKKTYNAHKVSYIIYSGVIDEGMHIDHLCRQRSCVNPYHLELVTQHENIKRGNATKNICEHGYGVTRCEYGCKKKYQRQWQRNKHGYFARNGVD